MNSPFRSQILPIFPALAGLLGLLLRIWLFLSVDEKGLLPRNHFAGQLLFILSAIVIVIIFLATRTLSAQTQPIFSPRSINIAASFAGGFALILNAVFIFLKSPVRLAMIATIASVLSGLILIVVAYLAKIGKRASYLFFAAVTVALMLNTVAQCQIWGALPQIHEYFFPMMASVCLVMTAYQKTMFVARRPRPKLLAFFSQVAVYFCIVSLNSQQWPLYLGMLFWSAAQILPCTAYKKKV